MAGYSGTPLAKKLGLKDGLCGVLLHMPAEVKAELGEALGKCRVQQSLVKNDPRLDFIFLFAKSSAQLEREIYPAAQALAPAGMLWIAWPKKTSGVATDLSEDAIRRSGLAAGLVDIKVCAVTEIWSGLKFVIPVKNRPARNAR